MYTSFLPLLWELSEYSLVMTVCFSRHLPFRSLTWWLWFKLLQVVLSMDQKFSTSTNDTGVWRFVSLHCGNGCGEAYDLGMFHGRWTRLGSNITVDTGDVNIIQSQRDRPVFSSWSVKKATKVVHIHIFRADRRIEAPLWVPSFLPDIGINFWRNEKVADKG